MSPQHLHTRVGTFKPDPWLAFGKGFVRFHLWQLHLWFELRESITSIALVAEQVSFAHSLLALAFGTSVEIYVTCSTSGPRPSAVALHLCEDFGTCLCTTEEEFGTCLVERGLALAQRCRLLRHQPLTAVRQRTTSFLCSRGNLPSTKNGGRGS